jgi:hypothetical protein
MVPPAFSQYLHNSYEVGDAPLCVTCGSLMVRNGSYHRVRKFWRYEWLLLIAERSSTWRRRLLHQMTLEIVNA